MRLPLLPRVVLEAEGDASAAEPGGVRPAWLLNCSFQRDWSPAALSKMPPWRLRVERFLVDEDAPRGGRRPVDAPLPVTLLPRRAELDIPAAPAATGLAGDVLLLAFGWRSDCEAEVGSGSIATSPAATAALLSASSGAVALPCSGLAETTTCLALCRGRLRDDPRRLLLLPPSTSRPSPPVEECDPTGRGGRAPPLGALLVCFPE